jgi:hypothetical protein
VAAPTSNGSNDMSDDTRSVEQCGEDILTFEISDDALEAAAGATTEVGMSIGGPISVNVMCCGGD